MKAETFLEFWFADACRTPEAADARGSFWFMGGTETDRACAPWAGLLGEAEAGRLDHWSEAPRSALALIVALDQLPRNLHRSSGRAFADDARALELAERAVALGWDEALAVPEAAFLLMPFQHAEDRAAQRRGGERYEAIVARAPEGWKAVARGYREFAAKHEAIIERFGRFPHRNGLLRREATAEEDAWLAEGGERFGQG